MLKLHYIVSRDDMAFPAYGRPAVRIRKHPDGTCQLTNLAAGHSTPFPTVARATEVADRIVRMLHAGEGR